MRFDALLVLLSYDNYLCLEKWQTQQVALLSTTTEGNFECTEDILKKISVLI